MNDYVIYKFIFPNYKVYIGQTKDFVGRKAQHKNSSFNKKRAEYYSRIGKAIRKYRWEHIKIEIICTTSKEFVDELERYFIKKYKSTNIKFGYNLELGGNKNKEGYWLGKKRPNISKGKRNPMYGRKRKDLSKTVMVRTVDGDYVGEFDSVTEASLKLNVHRSNIFSLLAGKRRTVKGYIFYYKKTKIRTPNYNVRWIGDKLHIIDTQNISIIHGDVPNTHNDVEINIVCKLGNKCQR